MRTSETIRKGALALPIGERAALAHDLIASLDSLSEYSLGPEQESEIKRRIRSLRDGKGKARSVEEAVAGIKARLK